MITELEYCGNDEFLSVRSCFCNITTQFVRISDTISRKEVLSWSLSGTYSDPFTFPDLCQRCWLVDTTRATLPGETKIDKVYVSKFLGIHLIVVDMGLLRRQCRLKTGLNDVLGHLRQYCKNKILMTPCNFLHLYHMEYLCGKVNQRQGIQTITNLQCESCVDQHLKQ